MHSQGAWPEKIMQPSLQTCAHQVTLIFKVSKNDAPAGCTYFKIMHLAAKLCTPGAIILPKQGAASPSTPVLPPAELPPQSGGLQVSLPSNQTACFPFRLSRSVSDHFLFLTWPLTQPMRAWDRVLPSVKFELGEGVPQCGQLTPRPPTQTTSPPKRGVVSGTGGTEPWLGKMGAMCTLNFEHCLYQLRAPKNLF